jgi:hypothetical protein
MKKLVNLSLLALLALSLAQNIFAQEDDMPTDEESPKEIMIDEGEEPSDEPVEEELSEDDM